MFAGRYFLVQTDIGAGLPDGLTVHFDIRFDGRNHGLVAVSIHTRFVLET